METTPPAEPLLRLLGLGLRAGTVVLGGEGVRTALQAGRVCGVVVAADASPRARDKVVRLARAKGIPLFTGPAAEAIGARLGRPAIMVAGVLDRALVQGLAQAGHGEAHREA